MKIIRHYQDVPEGCRHAIVAIGNFDGVHRGHRALIERARTLATQRRLPLAALAFEPHPREYFRPHAGYFRLTPFRTKARLLAENDLDILFALPFDAGMAGKTAEAFVREVLLDSLQLHCVVVGEDFRFGKGRAGDTALLGQLGRELGFEVDIFGPVLNGKIKISSSEIREALKAGRPEKAAELLGHWWNIEGRVEHGDSRGRQLGYPTANLPMDGYLRPAFGVYGVRASVVENDCVVGSHFGVASIGIRPMFRVEEPLLEVHLFDFDGDLYGKHLSVELIAYLRPELSFDSVDMLKKQMAEDAGAARRILLRQSP
ncbi:MAG TPA: bifunctional riboflavin kinase/FAD synthetase [Rhizomicrobium sp.]|nr:bifunctional riboflavin kinase/FAD synthetase [Rhizomicrobium sp.]